MENKSYNLGREINEKVREKLTERHNNSENISGTLEMMLNEMPGDPEDKGFNFKRYFGFPDDSPVYSYNLGSGETYSSIKIGKKYSVSYRGKCSK